MEIYNNKTNFKLGFVIIALIMGAGTVVYTSILVRKLAEREQKLIDLYAQALKFAVNPNTTDDLTFLLQEIIKTNNFIPVILSTPQGKIISYRNIEVPTPSTPDREKRFLARELVLMKQQHTPIEVEFGSPDSKNLIYYRNSDILSQLSYYPYVQLTIVGIFGFLTYLAFSYSRRAEQNRIWVGLAKETAHQLGTPISSLLAWVDYMHADPDFDRDELIMEVSKDIKRLEMITARFSHIGSEPLIKQEDIYFIVLGAMNYLQKRISTKVKINLENRLNKHKTIPLNRYLFEWVIENIVKNAVDAMAGVGELKVSVEENIEGKIVIDIADTGKGIPKKEVKRVFNAGFTTKKRGWGLGLTLAKRIIENYHKGKIIVKQTEVNKGTIFRIMLNP